MIFKLYFVIFILVYSCYLTETTPESRMKSLPFGEIRIKDILKRNLTYVDKTAYAFKLFSYPSHLFMNRPRRFGKSLFLDTLKEIALGNEKLFEYCEISKTGYQWHKHQVLQLDFSSLEHGKPGMLYTSLIAKLMNIAEARNISLEGFSTLGAILKIILKELSDRIESGKANVVVLIDEYDHPIVHHTQDRTLLKANVEVLTTFFTLLKSRSQYIRRTFVMGVTKLSLASIYSGANHLTDISMMEEFDTMFGFTHQEIITHFKPHVQDIAQERTRQGNPSNDTLVMKEIREWYDGYHFSTNTTESRSVYNPWSIMKYLHSGIAENYWLQTGHSTIANTVAFDLYSEEELYKFCFGDAEVKLPVSELHAAYDIQHTRLPSFLFQTGYLTISNYTQRDYQCVLSFPNSEVKNGLSHTLVEEKIKLKLTEPVMKETFDTLHDYLEINRLNLEAFFTRVNEIFSSVPHSLYVSRCTEKGCHIALHIFLKIAGFDATPEFPVHSGAFDILVTEPKLFILIEIKMDRSAQAAMNQMLNKEYKTSFHNRDKFIALVGLNFNTRDRKMEWEFKYYNPEGDEIDDPSKIAKILELSNT